MEYLSLRRLVVRLCKKLQFFEYWHGDVCKMGTYTWSRKRCMSFEINPKICRYIA